MRRRELAIKQILRRSLLLACRKLAGQQRSYNPEGEHAKKDAARDFQHISHALELSIRCQSSVRSWGASRVTRLIDNCHFYAN